MAEPQEEGLGDAAIFMEGAGGIENEKEPETGHDGQADRQELRDDPSDDPAPLPTEPGLRGMRQQSWLPIDPAQVAEGQRFHRLNR